MSAAPLPIQVVAQPAPRGVEFITQDEAARRSGLSRGQIRRKSPVWAAAGFARMERRDARNEEYVIREDADPRFARGQQPNAKPFDDRQLTTEKQRAVLRFRIATVQRLQQALSAGAASDIGRVNVVRNLSAELADERTPASPATLYNWLSDYERSGAAGLIDERWLQSAKQKRDDNPFFEELDRLYLDQRQRSVKLCYDRTVDLAAERHWSIPSFKAAQRHIAKIPLKTRDLHRHGDRKYNAKFGLHVERDYTRIVIEGVERDMRSNDVWVGDHHQFDVWVTVPGEAKPVRPWLTGWEDARSRKLIGWHIAAHGGNTSTILSALRMAVTTCGTPLMALTDNGKDYDAWAFQGVTKAQRRAGVKPTAAGGVFGRMGVQVRHAKPFNAKGKVIERGFGTICQRFSKCWETYCGRNPETRPADLPMKLAADRAPTLEEFAAAFSDYLDGDYHVNAHAGHGMEGRSPNQAYADLLTTIRAIDERIIGPILMRPTQPQKVGRNGVVYKGMRYGRTELASRTGEQVILCIDERDINSVHVYTLDGKPICVAPANERLPYFSTDEDVREEMAVIKADTRARKDYLERRPRMHRSLQDRLYQRAAKARTQQPSSNDPPPTYSPVRTPFEDQLPPQQQSSPLRIAVGAESQSEPIQPVSFAQLMAARMRDNDELE